VSDFVHPRREIDGFRLSYPHRLRRWPVAGENGMIGRSVAAVAVVLVLVSPCSV
jgi:hypothetical protein